MPLAEDDDMVETFPPDRADQPFRMSVLPWRAWCGWPVPNAHGTKPPGKNFAIDRVAIADDVEAGKNETIEIAKSEPLWRFSSQHNELVAQRHDLRLKRGS